MELKAFLSPQINLSVASSGILQRETVILKRLGAQKGKTVANEWFLEQKRMVVTGEKESLCTLSTATKSSQAAIACWQSSSPITPAHSPPVQAITEAITTFTSAPYNSEFYKANSSGLGGVELDGQVLAGFC